MSTRMFWSTWRRLFNDGDEARGITDIAEIGTDSHRLYSFTQPLVDNFHSVHEGRFQFDAYRKTEGYSNLPIDGIWARSPYLHNGSVPTLWDLLQKPADRPKKFYNGYDVYDPKSMGFVTSGPAAEKWDSCSTPACPATAVRVTVTARTSLVTRNGI